MVEFMVLEYKPKKLSIMAFKKLYIPSILFLCQCWGYIILFEIKTPSRAIDQGLCHKSAG